MSKIIPKTKGTMKREEIENYSLADLKVIADIALQTYRDAKHGEGLDYRNLYAEATAEIKIRVEQINESLKAEK